MRPLVTAAVYPDTGTTAIAYAVTEK
jgi:hypothetical protein